MPEVGRFLPTSKPKQIRPLIFIIFPPNTFTSQLLSFINPSSKLHHRSKDLDMMRIYSCMEIGKTSDSDSFYSLALKYIQDCQKKIEASTASQPVKDSMEIDAGRDHSDSTVEDRTASRAILLVLEFKCKLLLHYPPKDLVDMLHLSFASPLFRNNPDIFEAIAASCLDLNEEDYSEGSFSFLFVIVSILNLSLSLFLCFIFLVFIIAIEKSLGIHTSDLQKADPSKIGGLA